MRGKRYVKDNMAEKRYLRGNMRGKRYVRDNMSEEKYERDDMTEKIYVRDNMRGKRYVKDNMSEKRYVRDNMRGKRYVRDNMAEKRNVRKNMTEKRYSRDDIKDELIKLARSQSDLISEIIQSRTGDNRVFSGPPSQNACRDWWFVIAPACFFIEGLGHDPSSSYPCCGLDGKGAV